MQAHVASSYVIINLKVPYASYVFIVLSTRMYLLKPNTYVCWTSSSLYKYQYGPVETLTDDVKKENHVHWKEGYLLAAVSIILSVGLLCWLIIWRNRGLL